MTRSNVSAIHHPLDARGGCVGNHVSDGGNKHVEKHVLTDTLAVSAEDGFLETLAHRALPANNLTFDDTLDLLLWYLSFLSERTRCPRLLTVRWEFVHEISGLNPSWEENRNPG